MTPLTTIVTLLQVVLVLLSNPITASNPQAQTLAQQAVIVAEQALANQTTTLGTAAPSQNTTLVIPSAPTTTFVVPPQPTTTITYTAPVAPIGAPDIASIVTPPVQPTCTLKVRPALDADASGVYDWTSTEVSSDTQGTLYWQENYGIGNGLTETRWTPLTISFTAGQNEITFSGNRGPYNWGPIPPNSCEGTCDGVLHFRLDLGGATCYFDYSVK